MNHRVDPVSNVPACLSIGLPENVSRLVADVWGGNPFQAADTVSSARTLIDREPPHMVVLWIDGAEQAELDLLRRFVGPDAVIFLIFDSPRHDFPAAVDDTFELPRDETRLAGRLRVALEDITRQLALRVRANELDDQLQRYDLAFRGSDDGLWDAKVYWPDWFADDNEVYFSPRFKSMLGFEEDEFDDSLGAWKRRVHPDDQALVYQAIDDHLHRHVPFDIQYRMFNKKGDIVWIRGLGSAIWDFNDIPVRMAGSNRDITARKAAQDERDKFFEHSLDLLCFANLEGYFVRVNPAFTRVLGYTEEELLARPFLELVHPDDLPRTLREIERLRAGVDTLHFENRYLRKDGTPCWLSWKTPAPPPGETRLFAVARDITVEKQAQLDLQREQDLLKQMLEFQERDRKLIAYEIHDGVVQQTAAALMHLEVYQSALESDPPRAAKNLQRVAELLPQAVEEARRLISGLRPPALDDLGIVAGIAYLAEQASQSVEHVAFDPDDDLPELAKPLEDTLFRVAQESLNNAVRHSQSDRIEIRLFHEAEYVTLVVQDWGVGFDPSQPTPGHYGLSGMRERCRLMECPLTIESTPGKGATVTCRIPVLHDN